MKSFITIKKIQSSFVDNCFTEVNRYISQINKEEISTILISGSVSRGDFYPGKFGGMIDLTVFKKLGSNKTAEEIFGENEEPNIPYHCVKRNNTWFQIAFHEFIDHQNFQLLDEAKKYALLESKILYDESSKYSDEIKLINKFKVIDLRNKFNQNIGYIEYLVSDYKKDRWERREAYSQIHENLNIAIRNSISCLFYINNSYAPAEDRRLYYSYNLEKKPDKYENIIGELFNQDINSKEDYSKREKLFRKTILDYLIKNRTTTSSS